MASMYLFALPIIPASPKQKWKRPVSVKDGVETSSHSSLRPGACCRVYADVGHTVVYKQCINQSRKHDIMSHCRFRF